VGVEPTLSEPQSEVPPQHFGPLVGAAGNAPAFAADNFWCAKVELNHHWSVISRLVYR
jgi:hypothetical protein